MTGRPEFEWIPMYDELAQKLLDFEDRQDHLIAVLRELKENGHSVVSLEDRTSKGVSGPLLEIDPFTFFASFNRSGSFTKRSALLLDLKGALDLEADVPKAFDGVPIVYAQAAWFFGYQEDRQPDDIRSLWQLARLAVKGGLESVDPEVFNRCLRISSVALPKLTIGLFWAAPQQFLPYDTNTRAFLAKRGFEHEASDFDSYREVLEKSRQIDTSTVHISYDAWKETHEDPPIEVSKESVDSLISLMEQAFPGWKSFRDPEFEDEEISYKKKASTLANELLDKIALEKLLQKKGYSEFVDRLRKVGRATNLLYLARPSSGDLSLLNQNDVSRDNLCRAVFALLHGEGDSGVRIQEFADWQKQRGLKPRWTFPTYFLYLLRPDQDLFVKPSPTRAVLKHAEIGLDLAPSPSESSYSQLISVGRDLIRQMEELGARDMLDIQSLIWVCGQQLRKQEKSDKKSKKPSKKIAPQPSEPKSFKGLLARLEERGLHFPVELVSNYLLALQAKRFVLLTGVSGTGKTQLALQVAEYLRPTIKVETAQDPGDDGFPLVVRPYMLKHGHIVLPSAFVAEAALPRPDPGINSTDVSIDWPEGEGSFRMWRDPTRDVTTLSLKGDLRSWLVSNTHEGDVLVLTSRADPEEPDIRLALATVEERKELLKNYVLEAVRPDWTDNRGLLGYYNPLTGRYLSTPFLSLLLEAAKETERASREGRRPWPYFAILDEMNLARVEHYFSDFLSAMESGEAVRLHDIPAIEMGESADGEAIPRSVRIPPNFFFVGTVNIDESTYMFSPKVLDRAFTLELNEVNLEDYSSGGKAAHSDFMASGFNGELEFDRLPGQLDWEQFGKIQSGKLRRAVIDLNDALQQENRHFGYRVANEIARFVVLAADQVGDTGEKLAVALDLALLSKALPKLHGTQQELEPVLDQLFVFAVRGTPESRNDACLKWEWVFKDGELQADLRQESGGDTPQAKARFPRTARKLYRMRRRLQQQGFTSFVE